jgi:hypothetical protein
VAEIRDGLSIEERDLCGRSRRVDHAGAGDLHARPLHHAVVNRVLQIDRAEPSAMRHQVDNGGEVRIEVALRVGGRDERVIREWLRKPR